MNIIIENLKIKHSFKSYQFIIQLEIQANYNIQYRNTVANLVEFQNFISYSLYKNVSLEYV